MKKILDQLPSQIEQVYEQFGAATQRSANTLRWFFVVMFFVATIWSISDGGPARFIYPTIGLCWLIAALTLGLRAKTNLSNSNTFSMWVDLAIISMGIILCAWQGVFNTKGWIIFLCYFPVLALIARRFNFLLVLQAASFVIVFYAVVSLLAIESLVLPRLLAVAAMALASLALARKPKQELVEVARKAVQEAYQQGSSDKATEMVAFVHAQAFPPAQYNLPGLYTAYKHGVGTTTSGDFYTAFETASGPMVVIGDLPGNGLDAALAATQLQQQITKVAREKTTLTEIATEINALLYRQQQQAGCIFARWESANLHYLNAGHLPAVRISKREPESLPVNAPPLGANEQAAFIEAVLEFPKGEMLLLYTDGTYSGLASDRTTGAAEILRLTDQFSNGEVNTICHRIFDCALPEYRKPEDDSTVVIVRRQEFAGEAAA